jgi:hypothetical protein
MKKNVIVLGDSFIFGTGLADVEQRFASTPELIAQPSDYTWVSSLAKDTADRASIVNLSMPGMDNLGLVSGLCNYLDNNPVRPDVIIFNTCPPDRFLLQASRTQDLIDYESLRNPGVAVPKNLTTDTTLLTKMINLKDSSKARNWKIFFNGFVGLLGTVEHSDSVLSEKHKKTLVDFRNEIYHPAMGTQAALSAMMSTWLIAKTLNAEFYWMANNSDVENMSLLPTEVLAESKTRRFPHVSILAQTAKYRTRCGHTNEAGHDSYYNDIVKPLFINLGIIHA